MFTLSAVVTAPGAFYLPLPKLVTGVIFKLVLLRTNVHDSHSPSLPERVRLAVTCCRFTRVALWGFSPQKNGEILTHETFCVPSRQFMSRMMYVRYPASSRLCKMFLYIKIRWKYCFLFLVFHASLFYFWKKGEMKIMQQQRCIHELFFLFLSPSCRICGLQNPDMVFKVIRVTWCYIFRISSETRSWKRKKRFVGFYISTHDFTPGGCPASIKTWLLLNVSCGCKDRLSPNLPREEWEAEFNRLFDIRQKPQKGVFFLSSSSGIRFTTVWIVTAELLWWPSLPYSTDFYSK